MELGDSFYGLRNFVKGRISKYELEGIDPAIDRIILNSTNPAQSTVILDFESFEKLGKLIGLSDDDIWFYQMVTSPYQRYEAYDFYTADDDWKQGYGAWYDISDENMELMEKIAKYYFNTVIDWNDNDSMGEFGAKLDKFFPKSVTSIVQDWTHEKNREMNYVAREHVEKELDNFLKNFGLDLYGGDKIKSTVADLISLYLQFGVPHLSLTKQEKEDGNSLQDFVKMVDKVSNKYKINVWYDLPKDDKVIFKIRGFDRKDGKIDVSLKRRGTNDFKDFAVTEETFYRLLYQPELFRLEF